MEKQELIVKKDLSIENEKKFDDYLTEIQKKYSSLVVSKETEKDTKKVIAELRKLKKEINSNRIKVQKEYEKPAKLFKEKIDSKLSVIEGVISKLDGGVKQLEEARKAEKQNKINEIIETLEKRNPAIYKEFMDIVEKLEKHYKDMQDMEFTIEEGKLYFLQTRNGKRTAQAALKIAVDLVEEKLINKEEAILKVEPKQLDTLLHHKIFQLYF